MIDIPDFLRREDVLFLHERQLAQYGGASGIRDMGLLESALAQPTATYGQQFLHPTVWDMAAAYAFHIAQNQPFVDGNKRTGLLAAMVFLEMHEYPIQDPDGRLYQAMMDIAEHKLDKAGLAAIFRELSHTQSSQ